MCNTYKVLVFDLDGTISDPSEGIHSCVQQNLSDWGFRIEVPKNEVRSMIGMPLAMLYEKVCPESVKVIDKLIASHRRLFESFGYKQNTIYPNVRSSLVELSSKGALMAICTSKPEFYARLTLAHHNIEDLFLQVKGGMSGGSKSASLSSILDTYSRAEESIFIGDRAVDIESAQACGIASGAVTWGFGSVIELVESAPTRFFDNPLEWIDLVV